jgi:UDP-glucose:(heptosyl)LPS alpha-1,3-glucosyltransferase
MRLGLVLFNWFPQGGLQQDVVKVARACQGQADVTIYCMGWEGEQLSGVNTVVQDSRRFSKVGKRQAFADYVLQQVKPTVDVLVGFNKLPGLDYYFAADTCFAQKVATRPWWYKLAPRTRQYLRFETSVFGPDSNTVSLLLSRQQQLEFSTHYQTPAHRLFTLPPGIDRKHCADADASVLRAAFREKLGIAASELIVLQVGSSYGVKGVERSLLALAALPADLKERVHYCLLGRDKHADRWLQRAESTGLGKRVHFLPPLQSVPEAMQGADVLLHPSLYESAGMVILEAVVAGLPVVTTAACGYAHHVSDAGAGLVCPEPFDQVTLNSLLVNALSSERGHWRENGIGYGHRNNLYDMPKVVADILTRGRL